MGILMWDKPEKVMSKEEWMDISADGEPPGVYVPNMSEDDKQRWKAKMVGTRVGKDRVEIRKSARGSNMLIVVTVLEGGVMEKQGTYYDVWLIPPGYNIKISTNGPIMLSLEDFKNMRRAIEEAVLRLQTKNIDDVE